MRATRDCVHECFFRTRTSADVSEYKNWEGILHEKYRKGLATIVFAVLLVSLSACASKKLTVNEAEALVRAEMQEILQEQETEETGSYEIHVLKNTSQVTVKSIEMDGKSAVAV